MDSKTAKSDFSISNGHKLFIVADHFNPKGGDQPLFGRYQPL